MSRLRSAAIMILLSFGCGGDDAPRGASDTSTDAGASQSCTWPLPEASCTPKADFRVCVVPNDATEQADGTVVDARGKPLPSACKNACKSTDYALTCSGNDPDSPAWTESLGCSVVPIPTPFGVTIWCCPCVE